MSPINPEISLNDVMAETEAKYLDLKDHVFRKNIEGANEVELTFKSSKALGEFVTDFNKGTTPFNKHIVSEYPKIDFPPFIIGLLKKNLMNQKMNKFENSGHPMQNQYKQQMGGSYKYNQQMMYAQMMNQMGMMGGHPGQRFPPYNQQMFAMQQQGMMPGPNFQNRGPGQFQPNPNMQMHPGKPHGQRGPYGMPPQGQKTAFDFKTYADVKANRQMFDSMKPEDKTQVYKRLVLQKMKEIPEIINK